MCGVAGVIGAKNLAENLLEKIAHRGPDASGIYSDGIASLVHTRLSIVDPVPRSDQPFRYGSTVVSFNGEIWNHQELRDDLGGSFSTESDTETLAACLDTYGEGILPRLNGMFAFAWCRDDEPGVINLTRDRFGEIPLHVVKLKDGWMFASELKALGRASGRAQWVEPGSILRLNETGHDRRYYVDIKLDSLGAVSEDDPYKAADKVGELLERSCNERLMSDVPVCTLLSGGIDSSAIAALIAPKLPNLVAYTAVLDPKSRDLRMARSVASELGIELREVKVPPPTAAGLSEVVRTIELPHKAQVEIGWACLHLARRMKQDGFKVTYSGEGSDELWGSYSFAYHALANGADFREYRHELFATQHRKNFARCNKVFMAYGVECRLPFLNPDLVSYSLGLPESVVRDGKRKPKAVLERAMQGLLPDEVVYRPKVAFQDGMGLKKEAASAVNSPRRFYTAEHKRCYG